MPGGLGRRAGLAMAGGFGEFPEWLTGQYMILPFSNLLFHQLKSPCLSAVFLEEPDPGTDCGASGEGSKRNFQNCAKYQIW